MMSEMGNKKVWVTCKQARELDMVGYLATLGFEPIKIQQNNYWFLSPFRKESTASFKINIRLNRFYDFGEGFGGNLIDFGIRYYNCSILDFLKTLSGYSTLAPTPLIGLKQDKGGTSKIIVIQTKALSAPSLLRYLESRKIDLDIARQYCVEISYQIGKKNYFGIGFKNNHNGYEIRNAFFKGCCSPKTITTLSNNSNRLSVFEGFFDFLSFLILFKNTSAIKTDYLILNSLAFLHTARPLMNAYNNVDLYLDNDAAAKKSSRIALSYNNSYNDCSNFYKNHKDLNDFLCAPLSKNWMLQNNAAP